MIDLRLIDDDGHRFNDDSTRSEVPTVLANRTSSPPTPSAHSTPLPTYTSHTPAKFGAMTETIYCYHVPPIAKNTRRIGGTHKSIHSFDLSSRRKNPQLMMIARRRWMKVVEKSTTRVGSLPSLRDYEYSVDGNSVLELYSRFSALSLLKCGSRLLKRLPDVVHHCKI